MKRIKSQWARGHVALAGVALFFMATLGTLQWLTGGGWWGYLLWVVLYLFVVLISVVVPRIMKWIEAGESR